SFYIFWMHSLYPPRSDLRFMCFPNEIQPWLVEIGTHRIGTRHPNQHGRGICNQSKPGFTVPYVGVDSFAFTDIAIDGRGSDHLAVSVPYHRGRHRHFEPCTVLSLVNGFIVLDRTTVFQQTNDSLEIARVFRRCQKRNGSTNRLVWRVALKTLSPVIPISDACIHVVTDNRVIGRFNDGREPKLQVQGGLPANELFSFPFEMFSFCDYGRQCHPRERKKHKKQIQ